MFQILNTLQIRKFRTLTEILHDARDYVKDPYKGQIKKHPDYPKRPLTPYFRFFVENRVEYARKHSEMNNLEVTAELSKLYRELSPSIKVNMVLNYLLSVSLRIIRRTKPIGLFRILYGFLCMKEAGSSKVYCRFLIELFM